MKYESKYHHKTVVLLLTAHILSLQDVVFPEYVFSYILLNCLLVKVSVQDRTLIRSTSICLLFKACDAFELCRSVMVSSYKISWIVRCHHHHHYQSHTLHGDRNDSYTKTKPISK